jgi:Fic family protein
LEKELRHVESKGLTIFNVDLVKSLHKETMKLDPRFKGVPGKIRERTPQDVVCIRGKTSNPEDSVYNPAPPRHVLRCLKEVMRWYSDKKFAELGNAGMGMPLIARMAIGHSHFEAIHPFTDGNGRVGRMLLTLQMACQGKIPIYLSGFIEEEKSQYGAVLQAAQKKLNYVPIIEFFAEAIIVSQREALHTRGHLAKLPDTWLKRGGFRKDSTAERALGWLVAHPIFTAKQLQEQFSVSPQAANVAVELLQKHGVARERTGFERNRVFAAEEVISLLSRRFASTPEESLEGARALMRSNSRSRKY